MAKQILKGLTMLMVTIGIGFVTGVASANGQSAPRAVADIPFEFIIGNRTLPAGRYTAQGTGTAGNMLVVRSVDAKNGAFRLTNPIETRADNTKARLVFHKYGQRYFLSEVWMGGMSGVQLHKCQQERASEREREALASNSGSAPVGYDTVEIVASLR